MTGAAKLKRFIKVFFLFALIPLFVGLVCLAPSAKYLFSAKDLKKSMTIYSNITLSSSEEMIDIRYFDRVNVTIKPDPEAVYLMEICQINSKNDDELITTEFVAYNETLKISEGERRHAKFRNSTSVGVLSEFMLKYSEVLFSMKLTDVISNGTLNIFHDLDDCGGFYDGFSPTPVKIFVINRTSTAFTFKSSRDAYVCAVWDLVMITNTSFEYSVNANVRHYHNASYWNSWGQCLHYDSRESNKTESLSSPLIRTFSERSASTRQRATVIFSLTRSDDKSIKFKMNSTVSKTHANIGVIAPAAVSVFILITVCVCVCIVVVVVCYIKCDVC